MRARDRVERAESGDSDDVVQQMIDYWNGHRAAPPEPQETADGALMLAGARSAFVTFNHEALDRWANHANVGDSDVTATIVRGFVELFRSRTTHAQSLFATAAQHAKRSQWAGALIEATIGDALCSLELERHDDALAAARRAFRMARTEELPHHEVFSAIALARTRRCAGMPHLAAHILSSLSELAPEPWLGWIAWETLLAGRETQVGGSNLTCSNAARSLVDCLRACAEGDRERFEAAVRNGHDALACVAPMAADFRALCAAVDLQSHATGSSQAFRELHSPVVPRGLRGLETPDHQTVAHVFSDGTRPLRLLHLGLGISLPPGTPVLSASDVPGMRTTSAVIALLRTTSVDESSFFRNLYGFELEPVHRAVLDTLLHRVRATVAHVATLERNTNQLRLVIRQPFAIWDPACASPLTDRLLRLLASQGPKNPDDAAEHLGYSRRSVYDALKLLVEEGACRRAREGRRVRYVVEDSAFSAPTQARFEAMRESR